MSFRRDVVTTTTTRTPDGGPVRWWLLAVGVLAVLTALTWGFASSVQRATVSDAKGALAAAGLTGVTVDGATYRDVTLSGPAANKAAAVAALDALALPYTITYSSTSVTAPATPSASPAATSDAPAPSPSPTASSAPSPSASAAPVVIAGLPSLSGVQFETGSATLTGPSTGVLDQAAAAILAANEQHPALLVAINGYTDNQGDAAANVVLSQQRAQTVLDYLVSKGVAAQALTATGFGAANPIATNDTADGRAANRRVEFIITER